MVSLYRYCLIVWRKTLLYLLVVIKEGSNAWHKNRDGNVSIKQFIAWLYKRPILSYLVKGAEWKKKNALKNTNIIISDCNSLFNGTKKKFTEVIMSLISWT
jgi:hypothetical protein